MPISLVRSALPELRNPANRQRAVQLTYRQFRYAVANATSEREAKELYEAYAVPAGGRALFQAALANLNPWTEVKVDTTNPGRGPLLIVSGEKDHFLPRSIADGVRTSARSATTASPRSSRSRAAATRSRSTAAGERSLTGCLSSSAASSSSWAVSPEPAALSL